MPFFGSLSRGEFEVLERYYFGLSLFRVKKNVFSLLPATALADSALHHKFQLLYLSGWLNLFPPAFFCPAFFIFYLLFSVVHLKNRWRYNILLNLAALEMTRGKYESRFAVLFFFP